MNKQQDGMPSSDRLTLPDRCKVTAIAFAFWAILTAIFGVILAFGEPLAPLKRYPLNPEGWFIVRLDDGSIVREANIWDMVKAKYTIVLFLVGYLAVIVFAAYAFVLGAIGRRNGLTQWVLSELSRKSFRLSK